MNNEQNPREYRIPEANMPSFRERIAKLNKRAVKLKTEPIGVTVHRTEDVQINVNKEGQEVARFVRMHIVSIVGAAPKIAGWAFAAVLQPTLDESGATVGNLLRVVPGFEQSIPEVYRNASNGCDHCKTARRRNETFVLVSDAGIWKQVGRQCLRDFLGHQSPEHYASIAEMLMDAADFASMGEEGDDSFGGERHIEHFAAEEILALGASAIRLYGFTSKKTASMGTSVSTASQVAEWIGSNSEARAKWEHQLEVTEADTKLASETFEWMQGLSARSELTDYFYNLSLLGKGAKFTAKNFGLAISAISVFAKEQEREINRKKRFVEDTSSEYVGTVGTRSTFDGLTLVYTMGFESEYGVSHLYKFKSVEGNVVVWFSSSVLWNPFRKQDIEVGDSVNLTATVKAHELRDGVKQTKVLRGKIEVPKIDKKLVKFLSTIAWG